MAIWLRQIAPKARSSAQVTSISASFASLPLAGSTVVVFVGTTGTPTAPTVTDNQGGTYILAKSANGPASINVYVYYRYNVSAPSGTFTVTFNSSTAVYPLVSAFEYTGLLTSDPLDAGASGSATGTSSTPSVTGAGVSAQASEVWVTAFDCDSSAMLTITAPSGYTAEMTEPDATYDTGGLADRIASAQGQPSLSWTLGTSQSWACVVVALKGAVTNTAPSLSGVSVGYAGLTRTGPNNPTWTLNFTPSDAEQTGANALSWRLYTGAGRSGTLVASGTCSSGANPAPSIAYNAAGLVDGSNTLYLSVDDGSLISADSAFTLLRDDIAPSATTAILHSPSPVPVSKQYSVTFTPNDARSTSANEMAYQLRTATGGGGTLLDSGSCTSGTAKTTATVTDSALSDVGVTRYLRTRDGAGNWTDTAFTVAPTGTKSGAENGAVNATESTDLQSFVSQAASENAGAKESESASVFESLAVSPTENAGPNAAESASLSGTVDAADSAGLKASESAALLGRLSQAETASPGTGESASVQAIGDFPPARLRIDVYDPAGNRLGAGPIATVLGASYRLELDRIGSFAFRMPAGDEKASLVAQGNEVRIFREGEGLVVRGLVDRAEWVVDAEGSLVLSVSGSSIARRLAWENTLLGRAFDGASLSTAVSALLAGSGWSAGGLDTPAITLLARFDGLSVWSALTKVADVFGLHVREDPWNREVDLGAFGSASGVVLQNIAAVSPALRDNRLFAPIAGLRVLEESGDVWNRVIPLGAGEGVNQLDLRHATRSSPYALQSGTGPDGQTYWCLEDAASVAAYGRRTRVLSVKEALPLANSPAGFAAAANALYDVAASWLVRHKDPQTSYEVETVGLRHLNAGGSPAFQVGDRLRLVYRGLVQRTDGTTTVWKSVDASLWLMGLERTFKDDGSDAWKLTVSTVDRQQEDETSRLASVFEEMHALQVSLRPYTYREIHGPERRSVDPTHSVTFVIDYDANVAYLHQALLSVAVKPVRTNASGATTGGGSVTTSGGGSSHSHGISGQSASAGGGQTSSAEGSHTHSVSGQSANAAGSHRHQMFAAVGSGPAAYSAVPDVASTQGESNGHYHDALGYGNWNVGTHTHSMNNHRHLVTNYEVAGTNSSGTANVSFWMILPDGRSFSPVYTYSAAADHTHAVSATTSSSGSSHAHTVSDHSHAVSGTTSSAETSHSHSVTLPTHTHSLVFGIYEGASPTASANVTVTINGSDRTSVLGGPFDGDFLAKDITQYLQDAQGHPLRQRNTIVFTAGELLDLEIVCKSLVTATSLIPV